MKLFFTSALVCIAAACFSQRQNVYFLKKNGTYVQSRDSADYIRIVREPDSGSVYYNVNEYYPNGKLKLSGKSSKIDPPQFEEQCISFYENGNRRTIANYKKGLPVKDVNEFFPNGKPYVVRTYPDNYKSEPNTRIDFLITANYDSLGKALVTNGNGHYVGYESKFETVFEAGEVKNGKRDGIWKGQTEIEHNKIKFIENYADGMLISGSATNDKSGKTTAYTKLREARPDYPGGMQAFYKYLGITIKYPKEDRERNTQGRVLVSFVIERDGAVTDIHVVKSVSPGLDKEAVRAISGSPNWIPGIRFGSNVRVSYTVPVNFTLGRQ